jgi:hypothetical protein
MTYFAVKLFKTCNSTLSGAKHADRLKTTLAVTNNITRQKIPARIFPAFGSTEGIPLEEGSPGRWV